MDQTQEILDSFLSDAGDWGEKFVTLAFEIADNRAVESVVSEVFRGVHSIKGGASFIAQDEPRLRNLCDFCHDFETFLDGFRKGKTELNEGNRALVSTALYALHDDIVKLQNGEAMERHEEMLANFKGGQAGAISVGSRGNTLIFSVEKNLLRPKDVAEFNQVLWNHVRVCQINTTVVFDLRWKFRLSFSAIGSIIGTLGSVGKIAIIRPPDNMYLVFKRFRFEEFGIQVKSTLEELSGNAPE